MSLSLSSIPGFTEILDTAFAAGSAVSDAVMKALSAVAKFAVVRNEQFYGYYKNGEIVALPVSPADGYPYSRAELRYTWSWYWTGSGGADCNGATNPPTKGSTTGEGLMLQSGANVDQLTGLVSTTVSYYKTAQQDKADGILLVMVHAQRAR
jgi:hypothetical protein